MFITGIIAIDAPASALNNGRGEDNVGRVKQIRSGRAVYPYASAQALRFWIRDTLREIAPEWQASPVYHTGKSKGQRQQAFTMGDPLRYWDDDLFGYMRAQKDEKQGDLTVTRVAPFRTATLVSTAPVEIAQDFGIMGRGSGDFDYVLHEHEFYRAVLVGGFSLDLSAAGTFFANRRKGYENLRGDTLEQARAAGLETLADPRDGELLAYRLPFAERAERVAALLRALGRLRGGAKQSLHYTDVAPSLVCMAVMEGGDNPFLNLMTPTAAASIHTGALDEALTIYASDYRSGIYVGLRQGFADSSRQMLLDRGLEVLHPRQAFDLLAAEVGSHPEWFA